MDDVRWQCPRGHFVAHNDIRTEDCLDPSAYYGVGTSWEYTCRACRCTYNDKPRLSLLRAEDVDEVAVQRAASGDAVALNRAERRRAVAALTGSGHSAREIALRLRISQREVFRYRARLRGGGCGEAA